MHMVQQWYTEYSSGTQGTAVVHRVQQQYTGCCNSTHGTAMVRRRTTETYKVYNSSTQGAAVVHMVQQWYAGVQQRHTKGTAVVHMVPAGTQKSTTVVQRLSKWGSHGPVTSYRSIYWTDFKESKMSLQELQSKLQDHSILLFFMLL